MKYVCNRQQTNVQNNYVAALARLTYLGEGGKVELLLDYCFEDLLQLKEKQIEDVNMVTQRYAFYFGGTKTRYYEYRQ